MRAEDEARMLTGARARTRAELSELRGRLAALWTRRLGRMSADGLWRGALAGGGAALAAVAIIGFIALRPVPPPAEVQLHAPSLKLDRELRMERHEPAPR
jgi:hypothetical protein